MLLQILFQFILFKNTILSEFLVFQMEEPACCTTSRALLLKIRIEENAFYVSALITVCDSVASFSQFNPLTSTHLPACKVRLSLSHFNCPCIIYTGTRIIDTIATLTRLTGAWMDTRAGLNIVAKRRISVTARNIIVVAHPISSHFTH
jgi:hypothetical protein